MIVMSINLITTHYLLLDEKKNLARLGCPTWEH